MSDKLNCPFCGAELVGREDAYGNVSDVWLECPNDEVCEHAYTAMRFDVWQALIDGKKAQDALKVATDCLYEIYKDYDISGYCEEFISRTLDKIASITKQEKE